MKKLKQKVMDVVWVMGLGAAMAFCLWQIELIGWNQAVLITTKALEREILRSEAPVTVRVPKLTQMSVDGQIRKIFRSDAKVAIAISKAENGTRACNRIHQNKNGSVDIGVFQVNSVHAAKGNLYDCTENIKVAHKIYKDSGFNAWVAYKNGNYLAYLK
jgi:O-phosphoseryl-tRNA(Cys) synthetase